MVQAGDELLVWTTTPWTLVSNVALAVHPDLEYVELRKRTGADWTIVLAESRAGAVLGDDYDDRWELVARRPGSELAGQRYRRPLDWVPFGEGEHELIVAERFVSASDGSGVVHMAPAFGADDFAAGQRHGLAFLQPVDARGEFPADMPLVGGRFVKDADADIIEDRGIDRIDFLKLDVEGAEYDILLNCPDEMLTKVRRIVMEYHEFDADKRNHEDLVKRLNSQGFTVTVEKGVSSMMDWFGAWFGGRILRTGILKAWRE